MSTHMHLKNQSGFTLIETIVSISVLMLGILGPLTLAERNLRASREGGDRLIASYLAQEGIEMVRSVIANNSADNRPWLDGVTSNPGQCDQPQRCIVDVTQAGMNVLQRCNGACTTRVYRNTGTSMYRQSTAADPGVPWAATKFNREVAVITYGGAEGNKRIMASTTVWWAGGSISLQEDIYNWFFQLN